jgi:hypothetical protein
MKNTWYNNTSKKQKEKKKEKDPNIFDGLITEYRYDETVKVL